MVELIILIEPTASCVAVCMPAIWLPIRRWPWRSARRAPDLLRDHGEATAGFAARPPRWWR